MGFARVVGGIIAGLGLLWGAVSVLYVYREGGISSAGASWSDLIGSVVLATGAIAFGLWLSGGARSAWRNLRSAMKLRHSLVESAAWVILAVTVASLGVVLVLALAGVSERALWSFGVVAIVGWGLVLLFLVLLLIQHAGVWCAAKWRGRREGRRPRSQGLPAP
jgi:uncharacterized membrane protein YidH (DUF202 family)